MKCIASLLFLFFGVAHLQADVQIIKGGPIHEAFVTQEFGEIILDAVPQRPPEPITEHAPQVTDDHTIWVPGYWGWAKETGDYVWISGVWRRPPPGHKWISGYWRSYTEGWVRIRGFWSPVSVQNLEFISKPAPDAIDERVSAPPRPENNYFWLPGYWDWDSTYDEFQWLSGKWDKLDKNWIYTPAQYYWREDGYVLVRPYWDYPIDERGTAYADVLISQEDRSHIVFEPAVVVESVMIMEILYPYWPDHPCLFSYHYFFHYDLWVAWGAIPPWWGWSTWWCLPAQDTWALFWWWCHTDYPDPFWLDATFADIIQPPAPFVQKMMKDVIPPPTVTPNGVIGRKELIDAIKSVTGKDMPIMPNDRKKEIQNFAIPTKPPYSSIRPSGTRKVEEQVAKPNISTGVPVSKLPPGRVKVPPKPRTDVERPEIKQVIPPQTRHLPSAAPSRYPRVQQPWNQKPRRTPQTQIPPQYQPQAPSPRPHYTPQPRKPSSVPRTEVPRYQPRPRTPTYPPQSEIPQTRTPTYPRTQPQIEMRRYEPQKIQPSLPQGQEMQRYQPRAPSQQQPQSEIFSSKQPSRKGLIQRLAKRRARKRNLLTQKESVDYSSAPVQGNDPSTRYPNPPRPMQSQHMDELMTNPQPQQNPTAPRVHQLPGDESTLPNY